MRAAHRRRGPAATLAAAAAAGAVAAAPCGAQSPDSAATVEGIVFDSLLTRAPLAGAEVWAEGTARTARTDRAGRFVLSGLEPGRRRLAVTHPALEALAVTGPVAEVTLRAGASTALSLATPAPASAYARLCGAAPDTGAVVVAGAVQGSDGAPAAGALVWTRGGGAGPSPRAVSDAEGRFRLCGVPRGASALFAADAAGDGRARLTLAPIVDDRRLLVVTTLRLPDAPPESAALAGRVLTAAGLPVRGASVALGADGAAGPSARVDSAGRFSLALPAGAPGAAHTLVVRAVGFHAEALRVDATTAAVSVVLAPAAPSLAPVLTRATAALDLTGFEGRRASGSGGHFITAAEIERHNPPNLSAVLKNVPGITLTRDVTTGPVVTEKITSQRIQGSSPVRPQGCQVNVFVDGAYLSDAVAIGGLDTALLPRDVLGIEVYQGFANVPPQYQRTTSGCGTVLVWTKRGAAR